MVSRVIEWSLRNRLLMLLGALLFAAWGAYSSRQLPLDAIPDLSDAQVIVKSFYPGQSPQIVEDQVTYPLTSTLLAVPGVTAVRGFSMFGESYVYVVFRDGTDPYWARTRVLEYLAQLAGRLPDGVTPALGPDASGVGWIFEYALVDKQHRYNPDQLRAVQDFQLKYPLQSVAGVAEVASVGGMSRQFQIEVNPNRLAAYGLTLARVAQAVREGNLSGGGSVVEMGRAEYMVRAPGYLRTLDDFRDIPVGSDANGTAIRLQDVARIQIGAEARRGVTDLDGEGEAPGGIVVMRHGHNVLDTIDAVKAKLKEIRRSLPPGVELVVTYDRSGLIQGAVDTLNEKLLEESVAVALACMLFLSHLRSSLVVVLTLPVGILAAFVVMHAQGVSANLMSLGGIAIAIGAMVDAAIVMVENMHKHIERAGVEPDYWRIVRESTVEVGPALFFSLLVITVSFLPVFALTGQEGKLFTPLAYTKTFAMAASAALAITLTPVLMGYFIRGRIAREQENPLNRWLHNAYRPVLLAALKHRRVTVVLALLLLASAAWPLAKLGSEFMPPLYEGDLLYMPTTLPGISIDEAANALQITDRLIRQMPEVRRVYGKAGRADSATDPAPLSMFETTILLKPREQWPAGETVDELMRKLDEQVRLPGLTNSWGYPIRTRIDMLATGIRTPLGLKINGPELDGLSRLAEQVEAALKTVPGTRGVFAERAGGGRYLDIEIDRQRAARHGVNVADLQRIVQGAIGGENITTVVTGRERFAVNLRYPRAWRDSVQAISSIPVVTPSGARVHLGELARVYIREGAAEIKSENAQLVSYIYLNLDNGDFGGYVAQAQPVLDAIVMPPGYSMEWSGQYRQMQHVKQRLLWVVPLTLLLVALLLYLHFRDGMRVMLVLLCLPFALVGGFWLMYVLDYRLSVATAVGFIALAGVAAEFGVVMLLYLDQAWAEARRSGAAIGPETLQRAVVDGALLRIRPKMMTVSVIVASLLPVMISDGLGADVMKRIAAPLLGGMLTAPLLSLIVIPVLYYWSNRNSSGRASVPGQTS
ncbi:MAG: CusA/CzcA family heavy metal efflux RND transporter [Pseudomonadota bacterium]